MMTGAAYVTSGDTPSSCADPVVPMPSTPALPSESGYLDTRHNTGAGCSQAILDQFILQVQGHMWHSSCLRCCLCHAPLTHVCYSGHSDLYCQEDFFRLFGAKCSSCKGTIPPTDIVRRAQDNVYHMDCFLCMVCQCQLCTGDEFYLCADGQLLCKVDYLEVKAKKQGEAEHTNTDNETTKYNEESEKLFQHYYTQNARPRRDVLEKIALEVGAEPSDVNSWFRMQRAKNRWAVNGLEDGEESQCDTTTRVLAPPGGYPLPIVNKARSPGRLPEGANQLFMLLSEGSAHTIASHAPWSAWDELWSNDFVPPNVDLEPENLNNGEVIGLSFQHSVTNLPALELQNNVYI